MSEPIFDEQDALERLGGDTELLQMILEVFQDSCTGQLSRLEQAITASDFKTAYREAHSIKGAAANVSAKRIRAVASELERQMSESDIEGAPKLLDMLREEVEVFKTTIADRDT